MVWPRWLTWLGRPELGETYRREAEGAPSACRASGLGRGVVSSGDLRRRHAAGLLDECGGADRFPAPVVGLAEWRRGPGSRGSGLWNPRGAISFARMRAWCSSSHLPSTRSEPSPGYIQAYPPGVRENGGQYTHAAVWFAMALARRGDGGRAVSILRMLNPIERARDSDTVWRYGVEPYVVAADVYRLPGLIGHGGWSWYTGAASWMYQAWVGEVLGLKVRGDHLEIDPVIPDGGRVSACAIVTEKPSTRSGSRIPRAANEAWRGWRLMASACRMGRSRWIGPSSSTGSSCTWGSNGLISYRRAVFPVAVGPRKAHRCIRG